MELMDCPDLAVPVDVMHHVVNVESSFNPYAIGVVGGRLARQPANLPEALATARMLESRGFNFSLGLAQVNRYNLGKYGLSSYERAFRACPNLQAGSRILAECHRRSGHDWGKSFSCYYSGNFVTGFRQGYVQKIYASMRRSAAPGYPGAIPVYGAPARPATTVAGRRADGAPSRVEAVVPPIDGVASQPEPMSGASSALVATPDAPVVLQPGGRAPRMADAGRGAPSSPPAAAAPPRDAAFVF